MKHQYRVCFGAPNRVCVQSSNGLWYDREWLPGEKAAYEVRVLGR